MQNILSCRPISYGKYQDKAYEHLAKMGIKHVEILMPRLEDAEKALEVLDTFGLSVTSLNASLDIHSENVSQEFRLPVKVAETLGAKRIFVSVHAGDLDRKIAYQRLRSVGDAAAEGGVIVVLETHPDMATNGDVSRQTMEAVNHPNIRINFDTANIYYYNKGVNGIVEMKKILDFIESVHLKDTNGEFKKWYFPTLGEGIVDFRQVRELLNGRGFFGPFTIEIEGIEGENLTLEQTLERMEKSVQHLKECGY